MKNSKESKRISQKKWREKHLERIKEYNKNYYAQNIKKANEVSKKWRAEHPKETREYNKKWRFQNNKKIKEYKKAWDASHLELYIVYNQKYRAAKRNALENGITLPEWEKMKEETQSRCVYCCKKFEHLEMEHVIPISKGGTHDINNIVPACEKCNASKHNKSLLMFLYTRV